MYSAEKFVDYLSKPIPFSGKEGWNTIDLETYNIPFPQKDFLVLFTPLDSGEKYKWHNEYGEWYGMVLGFYKKREVKQLYMAIRQKNLYGYIDVSGQGNIVPAVVIHYATYK